jgi:hypothetical protein
MPLGRISKLEYDMSQRSQTQNIFVTLAAIVLMQFLTLACLISWEFRYQRAMDSLDATLESLEAIGDLE